MLAGALAVLPAASPAQRPAAPVALPFVGCAADGQTGRQAAPAHGATPRLPAGAAGRLAYYAMSEIGVIAPRGWHCFGLYGSNGATLIVTPEQRGFDDFPPRGRRISGQAVQVSYSYGGTSGRFAVARMISTFFPAHAAFVRQVRDDGYVLGGQPTGPVPGDLIRWRTSDQARVTTPAGRSGLGTDWLLAPSADSIESLVMLLRGDPIDMVRVDVRMPARDAALATVIIEGARRAYQGRRLPGS